MTLDDFARLDIDARRPYFDAAAERLSTLPTIIEKDFWVVWTLRHLYDMSDAPFFFFKGGTSLSKAFGVIERFSEDIDLIIDRTRFGYVGADDIAAAPSKTAREKRLQELDERVREYVAETFTPSLRDRFGSVLGDGFTVEVDAQTPTNVLFSYPSETAGGYVLPRVLIETGANADKSPAVQRTITAYVADAAPDAFEIESVEVNAVDVKRTFWEKLTILHKTAHRFDEATEWEPAPRYSRHYYDVYRLLRSEFANGAIADLGLAEEVRVAAELFFADRRARYDEFAPGSIRLVPPAEAMRPLSADYRAMRDMIFGEYPSFEDIVGELRALEERLNG